MLAKLNDHHVGIIELDRYQLSDSSQLHAVTHGSALVHEIERVERAMRLLSLSVRFGCQIYLRARDTIK